MSMVSDWAARAVETRATELNLMIISTSQKRQWQQIRCVQLKSRSYLNYFFVNYFKTNQIESGPNLGNFVNSLQSNFTTIINYIIDNNLRSRPDFDSAQSDTDFGDSAYKLLLITTQNQRFSPAPSPFSTTASFRPEVTKYLVTFAHVQWLRIAL